MLALALRHLLYLSLIALAGPDAARGQSPAELRLAREIGVPGLRLVHATHMDAGVGLLGIQLGYVEQGVTLGTGRYFCGALSVERSAAAAQPVSAALARLPYVSVYKLGLRYVILCGGLKHGDRPVGGTAVPVLDLFMLEVGASANAAYLEAVTLHEVYHLTEFRFNTFDDVDWGRQFTGYSHGYAPDLLKGALGTGKPGFLNAYSETFPYEDRAELFSALLLKPDAVLARIRAMGDSVLRRKVLYMDKKSAGLLALRLAPDWL